MLLEEDILKTQSLNKETLVSIPSLGPLVYKAVFMPRSFWILLGEDFLGDTESVPVRRSGVLGLIDLKLGDDVSDGIAARGIAALRALDAFHNFISFAVK